MGVFQGQRCARRYSDFKIHLIFILITIPSDLTPYNYVMSDRNMINSICEEIIR